MFANLLQLLGARPAPELEHRAFIHEVRVRAHTEPRNARVERLILICWMLIAIKHVGVLWAVRHHAVPFDPLWINLPTWLLGTLATAIYFWRVRKKGG